MITLERIIAQALRDPLSFAMLRNTLTSTLVVANPHLRTVVEWAAKFWDEYKKLPRPGDFEVMLEGYAEPQKSNLGTVIGEVLYYQTEDWTPEYIVQQVGKTLKDISTRNAVARLGTMMPNVPPEAISQLNEELKRIEPISIDGLRRFQDIRNNVYSLKESTWKVACPFEGLSRLIGGFRPELIYLLADAGVGKSSLLINIGAHAAVHGARVLHLTFELSADNTLARYYRNVAESVPGELKASPEDVIQKLEHWQRFTTRRGGCVDVLYRPAYSVGLDDLRGIVDQYRMIYGGVDLVILDYLDLMKVSRSISSKYEALGELSHQVRGIGLDIEATMLSATQATRSSHLVPHIRLDMMGDSYNKVRAADIILGFVQTPEEEQAFQARLAALKLRESAGRGWEWPLYVNLDVMRISDLDSPDTRRIMARFGHQLVQVAA